MKLTKPIKIHGGKEYLADLIIKLMPPRCKNPNKPDPKDKGWLHYVEPYFGGGSVLLRNNPEGISEVANDLNGELSHFWETLQGHTSFNQFMRLINAVSFSEAEFDLAKVNSIMSADGYGETTHRAATFFIRCRQSLSGRMDDFASITRERTRRGMNEQVSAWLNSIDGLADVHARLSRVLILNRDAIDCIKTQDGPRTLFYLDPPYLKSTRAADNAYGDFEMSDRAHAILLALLSNPKKNCPLNVFGFDQLRGREHYHEFKQAWIRPFDGRFLLSGYPSELYWLFENNQRWKRHEKKIDNKAAGGAKKRIMTECVWTNY